MEILRDIGDDKILKRFFKKIGIPPPKTIVQLYEKAKLFNDYWSAHAEWKKCKFTYDLKRNIYVLVFYLVKWKVCHDEKSYDALENNHKVQHETKKSH